MMPTSISAGALLTMSENTYAQKMDLKEQRSTHPQRGAYPSPRDLNCHSPSTQHTSPFGDTTEEFICAASGFSSIGSFLSNPTGDPFNSNAVDYSSINRHIETGTLTTIEQRIHFLLTHPPSYERQSSPGTWYRWADHPLSQNLYNCVSRDYPSNIFLPDGAHKYLSIFKITDPYSIHSMVLPLSRINGRGPVLGGIPNVREGIVVPGRWNIQAQFEVTVQCDQTNEHIIQQLQELDHVANKTLKLYNCSGVRHRKHLFYLSKDSDDPIFMEFTTNITYFTQVPHRKSK